MADARTQQALDERRARISEATAFDDAELFETEAQVRQYFTVAEQAAMHGTCPSTQEELNAMAEDVIANRWHMEAPR